MEELIKQIKFKADSIPTNTKENRRVKGAYVDCLMMLKEALKNSSNPVLADIGCFGCVHYNSCGIRIDYGNGGCDEKEL